MDEHQRDHQGSECSGRPIWPIIQKRWRTRLDKTKSAPLTTLYMCSSSLRQQQWQLFGSKLMCLLSILPCLKVNLSSEIVKWSNNTNSLQNWKWWLRIYDNITEISPFFLRVKVLKVFLLHFGTSSIRHLKPLNHTEYQKKKYHIRLCCIKSQKWRYVVKHVELQ